MGFGPGCGCWWHEGRVTSQLPELPLEPRGIPRRQKLRLFDPIVLADAPGEDAELGVDALNFGIIPCGDLGEGGNA